MHLLFYKTDILVFSNLINENQVINKNFIQKRCIKPSKCCLATNNIFSIQTTPALNILFSNILSDTYSIFNQQKSCNKQHMDLHLIHKVFPLALRHNKHTHTHTLLQIYLPLCSSACATVI